MVSCYLGLGSNLGNREELIKLAIRKIDSLENTKVIKRSKLIETKAEGGPANQPKFLNGALKIKTSLAPLILLKKLKAIEKDLGRKKSVRNGPRVIDLDILLYDDLVFKSKALNIPHPRILKREFVVKPLMQIL